MTSGGSVRLRKRQPLRAQEHKESTLKAAESHVDLAMQDASKCSRTSAGRKTREHDLHLLRSHLVTDLCLVTCPPEGLLGECSRQIDECAWDRRQWDSVAARRVFGIDAADAMSGDTSDASLHQRDHLGTRRFTPDQAPEECSRPGTQERALSACQDRSEIPSFYARRSVPHAIYAGVFADQ